MRDPCPVAASASFMGLFVEQVLLPMFIEHKVLEPLAAIHSIFHLELEGLQLARFLMRGSSKQEAAAAAKQQFWR